MITFRNLTLRRGANILIEEVNWTIYHKQRFGLVGANGSGKTSLFGLFQNIHQPDKGDIDIPKQLKIAHVEQETPSYRESALDFVLDGDVELRRLEVKLKEAEQQEDGMLIATIYEKLGEIDAYTAPARAAQLLAGLGFSDNDQKKSVAEFSGGWRVRLNLAKALMCSSDMLLLDEPTNHLDLDAVLWLEKWIQKYQGTLLLISHDRDFLDQTVDHIAHISHQRLKVYTGNYSGFEKLHAEELMLQQAMYEKQQKKVAHLQSFINRFSANANKAKQAQSRVKALARMDLVCAVQAESAFSFEFKEPSYCPNPLIHLSDARAAYGDHVVLKKINFSIAPKDRIAILGPNGAGKSTFIKMLAGELAPVSGVRQVGSGLKIGYFAQHQVDHLHLNESPLSHLRRIAERTAETDLRKFLGGFDFSGDRVLEPVRHFSGGEKSRLALALLVWQKPNLLLLDEPTNHLDLEMRNALSIALQEYEGAMILVSHDRFLVRTTTDSLLLIANGELEEFSGDLDEYQKWLLDFRKQQMSGKREPRTAKIVSEVKIPPRPNTSKIKKLEDELAVLEKKANEVELLLAGNDLYLPENKEMLSKYLSQQKVIREKQEKIEQQWLAAHENG